MKICVSYDRNPVLFLSSIPKKCEIRPALTIRPLYDIVRLAKMNLAVHGLGGDIRQGNTYYEDLHTSTATEGNSIL